MSNSVGFRQRMFQFSRPSRTSLLEICRHMEYANMVYTAENVGLHVCAYTYYYIILHGLVYCSTSGDMGMHNAKNSGNKNSPIISLYKG